MTSIIISTGLALLALVGFVGSWYSDRIRVDDVARELSANLALFFGFFGLLFQWWL